MVKVQITYNENTPDTVKKDLHLYFTRHLKMVYDKEYDIYTITNPNFMDTDLGVIHYIDIKNYITYINTWDTFYTIDSNDEFAPEEFKYTFDNPNLKFAKEDAKESYLRYN